MATKETTLKMEDVAGVRSRVSWPAILAGAVAALSINLVFTIFLAAIGITLTDSGVRSNAVGIGALIASLIGVMISLFVGGWVTTQMTAGETDQEAILLGILTWAVVVALSMAVVTMGVRAGYFALVGGTMVAQQSPAVQNWEQTARNAGVPEQRIAEARAAIDPQRVVEAANDPAARERAENAAVGTAWATLVGVMLSMVASIGGALCGRGAAIRLFAVSRNGVRQRELVVS